MAPARGWRPVQIENNPHLACITLRPLQSDITILMERSACRHDDESMLMRYLIWAKSPDTEPIQAEGTWVVEAAHPHQAVELLQQPIHFEMWPQGSAWTVKPWTPDASDVEGRMRFAICSGVFGIQETPQARPSQVLGRCVAFSKTLAFETESGAGREFR